MNKSTSHFLAYRFYKISLLLTILVLISTQSARADFLHFHLGDKPTRNQNNQYFHVKAVAIEGDLLVTEIFHGENKPEIVKFHITRVLSFYFNDKYEHDSNFKFFSDMAKPVPGAKDPSILQKLRATDMFKESYQDIKAGKDGPIYNVPGNIIGIFPEQSQVKVKVKKINGDSIDVMAIIGDEIKAWIR